LLRRAEPDELDRLEKAVRALRTAEFYPAEWTFPEEQETWRTPFTRWKDARRELAKTHPDSALSDVNDMPRVGEFSSQHPMAQRRIVGEDSSRALRLSSKARTWRLGQIIGC
jgi:hypothetical protein